MHEIVAACSQADLLAVLKLNAWIVLRPELAEDVVPVPLIEEVNRGGVNGYRVE